LSLSFSTKSMHYGKPDYVDRGYFFLKSSPQPGKIILFGSYAYGQPTPESDVDLLVVMPFDGGYFHQAAKIRRHLALPIPLDLLVRTPEQPPKSKYSHDSASPSNYFG